MSFNINFALIKNSILFKNNKKTLDSSYQFLQKNRIGQEKLRRELLEKSKKCQITNLEVQEILVTSHIKPWINSNDSEKIDVNNVLLLSATFDKLFDRGLMSFTDTGDILFSDLIPNSDIFKLSKIIFNKNIDFSNKQKDYINYHKKNIFRYMNGFININLK